MTDDVRHVEDVLLGTALGGRPVERVAFAGHTRLAPPPEVDHDVVLFVRCEPDEIEHAWQAARSVVDETSRWPVATAGWSGEPLEQELFSRIRQIADLPPPLDDHELDAHLGAKLDRRDSFRFPGHERQLGHELETTVRTFGSAPSLAEAQRNLGPDPGKHALDRWLFQWEQTLINGRKADVSVDDTYLNWFVPTHQPCCIVLLPSATSWRAGALLDFYGVSNPDDSAVFLSLLRRWHDRWGAEIVASFGTMLELIVTSPPDQPQDLLDLAIEQHLLASCTTMLPMVPVRHHARALAGRPTWFLHERP